MGEGAILNVTKPFVQQVTENERQEVNARQHHSDYKGPCHVSELIVVVMQEWSQHQCCNDTDVSRNGLTQSTIV